MAKKTQTTQKQAPVMDISALEKQVVTARMDSKMGRLKNVKVIARLRDQIARLKTEKRMRELNAAQGEQ